MFQIAITNQQELHKLDRARIRRALRTVLKEEGVEQATLSVAIVDDAEIRRLHREFLQIDRPTDVLSFVLEETSTSLDGEVIASADTAAKSAARYGWTTDDELLLYVVHGTLHLLGYEDESAVDRKIMRSRECHFLGDFGLTPRYDREQPRRVSPRRAAKGQKPRAPGRNKDKRSATVRRGEAART